MQIETEVDEAFIGMIEPDQPVRFTVFAYQKRQFSGNVSQVRLNPTIEAGVVKYNCIIYVDNSDLALKPGMTATVTIEVDRSDNVLKVPNTALRYVPDWPATRLKKLSAEMDLKPNEGVIWVPKGNQGEEVKPVKVALGTAGEKETQISGEGIQEGMPVVVPPSRQDNERRRRFGLSLF
jgi:HlyD family secretion protein